MEYSMVNSSSFGSERNGNSKACSMQTTGLHNKTSSSPLTASSATQSKNDFTETVDTSQLCKTNSVESASCQTQVDETDNYDRILSHNVNKSESNETKKTLFCSFPLEKVQTILSKYTSLRIDNNKMKIPRKVLCLYCDRTFVNVNLRQKHVERCHSSKQLRRVSLRKHQNFLTSTPCIYCDKFTSTEHTLKNLFKHLVENHSNKYFGCLTCEMRFLNVSHLRDHNVLCHNAVITPQESSTCQDQSSSLKPSVDSEKRESETPVKTCRRKYKKKENLDDLNVTTTGSNITEPTKCSVKNVRNKRLSVKSSRIILKRSKRLQAKVNETPKKKRTRDLNEKNKNDRTEQTTNSKLNEKTKTTSNFVNPYPEFDNYFQVKKITDHSIDNLKITSLTFDDVFDKAFFNRIKCNIQENLLYHIDGKLFKNEESESRISNFEKISNIPQETQNLNTENFGCELSLNAIAPTTLLLSNQLGDDPEMQIEYGSKPSKKKTQMKKDEVHYKYFTRRKYQASILEHKENRDLSKLDMWTQYIIKNRQQKILDDKKSPKEILDYFAGEEYKNMMRREELNRILDRRGPFEDLREEVSKKAALDKLNGDSTSTNEDHFAEVGELLNDILNRVFELAKDSCPSVSSSKSTNFSEDSRQEIPSYLNLRPCKDVIPENEIDRSDKIALICSSQETENFELPSNRVRGKDEKVELTGEWARSRIYVCAACGLKLQNIKQFLEHKSASHQYIWVQHYEFVGNQSELYRNLSIPVLGKVGVLENLVQCKMWKRSDARMCTKCGKQCNSLGELHRHILECGGDWTWMLARKKCKYRPFGAKSRRKRRGLVKRIYAQKTEPSEKKIYKKTYDMPRQKPSDADTIKRMLANLPPKRATRKIMSLKDGFTTTRTKQVKTTKQTKFKCGKLIRGKAKEKVIKTEFEKISKNQSKTYRRSLRCLNKVLTSRILDTNSSIIVRRKYTRKIKNEKKQDLQTEDNHLDENVIVREENSTRVSPRTTKQTKNVKTLSEVNDGTKTKRSSPRIEKRLEFGSEKMNIKRFFPVKKKKTSNAENLTSETNDSESKSKQKKQQAKNEEQLVSNVNLRKRKIEISETNAKKKRKVRKTGLGKKRKLKNEPSELDLEVDDSSKNFQTEIKDYFESLPQSKSPEMPNLDRFSPIQLEKHRELPICEEEPVLENQNLHINVDPDLEKEILTKPSIEKTEDIQLVNSVQTKRKRKPARGLNDCIAMLTSKLGKSFAESARNDIFKEETPAQTHSNNTHEKSEFILKVPLSNEHFHLLSKNEEKECLNASNLTQGNKLTAENDSIEPPKPLPENVLPSFSKNTNLSDIQDLPDVDLDTKTENFDAIMEEPTEDNSDLLVTNECNGEVPFEEEKQESTTSVKKDSLNSQSSYETDSEDEIPLSNLLKDECQTTDRETSEDMKDLSDTCGVSPLIQDTKTNNENELSIEENVQTTTIDFDNQIETEENFAQIEEETEMKTTNDTMVLMEINDNFSEQIEVMNSINPAVLENSKNNQLNCIVAEAKLEDPELTLQNKDNTEKWNILNETKHLEDVVSIEKQPKLDTINFFVVKNVEDLIWKNSISDITSDVPLSISETNLEEEKRLRNDTSEYKENSMLGVEDIIGRPKQRKKAILSNKTFNKNLENVQVKHKENFEKLTDSKANFKNVKTKAFESALDDALLELSDSEVLPQDNLNSVSEDVADSANVAENSVEKDDVCMSQQEQESKELGTTDLEVNKTTEDSPKESENCNKESKEDEAKTESENKELRRSSRNSKRVTSYNETDLIDPLLDDFESDRTISKIIKETTKDIFGIKRKSRKSLSQKKVKNGYTERKLNGEELFDLLKTVPNENVLSKPPNTFFNTFDEISNEFNDDNFDVFEDILEKSIAVIEENLSEPPIASEMKENQNDQNYLDSGIKSQQDRKKKSSKKKTKKYKHKTKNNDDQFVTFEAALLKDTQTTPECLSNVEPPEDGNNLTEVHQTDKSENEKKNIYCDICDKSFCRVESLTKHKRTLTHISKLSELEAKEAALKTKCDEISRNEETEITQTSSDSRKDLNLLDILGNIDEGECKQFSSPFAVNVNKSNLKLADIINDVLNKPLLKKDEDIHSFPDVIMENKNENQHEVRRCKSLAERKSFDSENCLISSKTDPHLKSVDYFEPEISCPAAGTILEKQITLLENIIENRSTLGFDELSVSSSPSVNENLENEIVFPESKQIDTNSVYADQHKKTGYAKINMEESFLKPSQYEEISEDSNLRNYDEQKARKALNRDEELFLECCSLLKSGSEVSSYSKKSNQRSKDLNNPELKTCEPDWLESNLLSQKDDFVECYSDSSRIRTPLGDSFSQEDSNSATISSQWDMNSKEETWKGGLNLRNKNLTFEEVFSKDKVSSKEEKMEKLHTMVSSFDHVISEVLKTELNPSSQNRKTSLESDAEENSKTTEVKDTTGLDGKKMLTKGAMKIFEGLKVSIPTEELNIDKILTSGSSKSQSSNSSEFNQSENQKKDSESQSKSNSKTKTKRSMNFKKQSDLQMNSKIHDVYDFEETQDNSDVFTRPDFRSFRTNYEKNKKDKPEGSDDESRDCTDTLCFDAVSSSASSVSEVLPVKSRQQQNITKKKCMIMGRIFKNAVKSRTTDDDIRSIPIIDNTKLVEDFVLSCPEPVVNDSEDKKPRMTEEEMNLAFDKLISKSESKQSVVKTSSSRDKTNLSKRKQKSRNKKRNYGGSDSSDDEFKLQKYSNKRPKKNNNNTEDSCINLEQELRECIGVASRKSQRKCTSGKQNVLIEYWSSDESSFEAVIEKNVSEQPTQKNYSSHNSSIDNFVQGLNADVDNVGTYTNVSSTFETEVTQKKTKTASQHFGTLNRRKRITANPLYHWSSSSEDESRDLIEVRPARDEVEDDEDRPVQHGWIVGDSPKKLVTMLAQAKGKKCEIDSVKEHGRKRTSTFS